MTIDANKLNSRQRLKLNQLLRQRWCWHLSLLALGCLAATIAAFITWLVPYSPRVHDEFSNLLIGDTLLHGRLSNPSPEVWEPFQTFHVIMEPSYASKYPLAAGILVALGRLVLGVPIAGAWIAAGIGVVSVTWMLAGITSRKWAMFGGLMLSLHPTLQIVWSQNVFGAWWTAIGAALLLGGVLRLRRRHIACDAVLAGCGIGMLALSRPFEGLVFTVCCALFWWLANHRMELSERIGRAVRACALASLPIVLALGLISLQNKATTGSFWRMPHQEHESRYGVAPVFVFGTPGQPERTDVPEVFAAFHHGWSMESFRERNGWDGWLSGLFPAGQAVFILAGAVFGVAALSGVWWWSESRVQQLLYGALLIQVVASAIVCWVLPHYIAPSVIGLLPAAILGLRRCWRCVKSQHVLRGWDGWQRVWPAAVLVVQCVLLFISVRSKTLRPQPGWIVQRAALIEELHQLPGQHLVLVQYSEDHDVHQEWVYNEADMADAKILWAHDDRPEWHQLLVEQYQSERQIWQLKPDEGFELYPLPSGEFSSGSLSLRERKLVRSRSESRPSSNL